VTNTQEMPPDSDPMVRVRGLEKTFRTLDADITAVAGIDLDVPEGTITALVGPSGSGKSTLLHLIGALDPPDAGEITVAGQRITGMSNKQLAEYRRTVGFVFQNFNLLATLTVLDNVVIPVVPYRTTFDPYAKGRELLATVGLGGRENTLATRLSGGQQQRVAIARALINDPRLVLADEPTGNLDTSTGEEIIRLLFDLRDSHGATLIIATHDPDLAKRCDQVTHIRDGQIIPEAT
jgi:ABC-type lipoprotein export system ATPase subunit